MSDSNRKAREWWIYVPKPGPNKKRISLVRRSKFDDFERNYFYEHHVLEATPLTKAAGQLLEALKELVAIIDDKEARAQIDSFTTQPAKAAIAQAERGGE